MGGNPLFLILEFLDFLGYKIYIKKTQKIIGKQSLCRSTTTTRHRSTSNGQIRAHLS